MEGKFGGKAHNLYGPVVPDIETVGKKSLEWNLNDWKWDGDLFTATPLNSGPSDCRSRQFFPVELDLANSGSFNGSLHFSDDNNEGNEKGKSELEKKRRVVILEDEELKDEAGALNLNIGAQVYPITDGDAKSGKKSKLVGTTSNRAVCQVDDCRADLSSAKDYHRRHKVCDVHSKASEALVSNVMQRFCQQCSRFHALQEFDEGKRSCRRRLAGHNKRRRKTHPDNNVNGGSLNDERGSSYLLISLLRILANMHANSSEQSKDEDLLSHLLKNLTTAAGVNDGGNISRLLQGSKSLHNAGTSIGNHEKGLAVTLNASQSAEPSSAPTMDDNSLIPDLLRPLSQYGAVTSSNIVQNVTLTNNSQCESLPSLPGLLSTNPFLPQGSLQAKANEGEASVGRMKLKNIDLNNLCEDSEDRGGNIEWSQDFVNLETRSFNCALRVDPDSQKSNLPYMSRNSDSTSMQSLSSSSGEAQSHTDRIVFKLFGKAPSDFPVVLRRQILDWLAHSPTDIESYIRPGCIVLTIYLCMGNKMWEELSCDLGYFLRKFIDASDDSFWRTGWMHARLQHHVAFVYNGEVVLDTPLLLKSQKYCSISSIKPIAVTLSARVKFIVKGVNLFQPSARLHCALEGRYLVQGTCFDLVKGAETVGEHDKLQFLSFSCSIPSVYGRGFIEVEDHGLSSSFFPFIVAEPEVCSEICMLESAIDVVETTDTFLKKAEMIKAKNDALEFLHEMGWLLHRSHLKIRLGQLDPNTDLFKFKRFKWLMEFSLDHDWCAVVKKLLGILFDGNVSVREQALSVELALLDMGLLHRAVQRNCRPMVELLLRYVPDKLSGKQGSEQEQQVDGHRNGFIFKPNVAGPAGLTPLHVAAGLGGCENVLDALTDDPESVGIEAWKSSQDSTGLSPYDYACLRGHYSYINLVQKKINKKSESRHVVLDIPGNLRDSNPELKSLDGIISAKYNSLKLDKIEPAAKHQCCSICEGKLAYSSMRTVLVYRPAMLSMVAIAAVCVCVALLFKSSPEVLFVFEPFRWERLKYGYI